MTVNDRARSDLIKWLLGNGWVDKKFSLHLKQVFEKELSNEKGGALFRIEVAPRKATLFYWKERAKEENPLISRWVEITRFYYPALAKINPTFDIDSLKIPLVKNEKDFRELYITDFSID